MEVNNSISFFLQLNLFGFIQLIFFLALKNTLELYTKRGTHKNELKFNRYNSLHYNIKHIVFFFSVPYNLASPCISQFMMDYPWSPTHSCAVSFFLNISSPPLPSK